jgi:hypothetical protein
VPPQRAILRITSEGGVRLIEIREYLAAIEDAYNGVVVFENLVDGLRREGPFFVRPFFPMWLPLYVSGRKRRLNLAEGTQSIASFVRSSERIVLLRVKLESPGVWEFLGKLNPLEVIRQWVADSHERRKDKNYREAAEQERLRLENGLLENRVIRERIQIARELGATNEDLAPVLNDLILKPLAAVSQQQNKGLIQGAELEPLKE